jgi:hypothetical protein
MRLSFLSPTVQLIFSFMDLPEVDVALAPNRRRYFCGRIHLRDAWSIVSVFMVMSDNPLM